MGLELTHGSETRGLLHMGGQHGDFVVGDFVCFLGVYYGGISGGRVTFRNGLFCREGNSRAVKRKLKCNMKFHINLRSPIEYT